MEKVVNQKISGIFDMLAPNIGVGVIFIFYFVLGSLFRNWCMLDKHILFQPLTTRWKTVCKKEIQREILRKQSEEN